MNSNMSRLYTFKKKRVAEQLNVIFLSLDYDTLSTIYHKPDLMLDS